MLALAHNPINFFCSVASGCLYKYRREHNYSDLTLMVLSPTVPIKFMLAFAAVWLSLVGACANGTGNHPTGNAMTPAPNAIDINRASAVELTTLPGIGETIAARIVEFRERNGPFRRTEQLLLVPGISEKKFREIQALVKTDSSPHDE